MGFRSMVLVAALVTAMSLTSAAQAPTTSRPGPLAALSSGVPGREPQIPSRDGQPQGRTINAAVIRGRVVQLDNGQPLRRAYVGLTAAGIGNLPTAMTDDNGRFELKGLAAARYTLTASKSGFVTLKYGQRRHGEAGRLIEVGNGQVLERLDLALPRGSAITGRVVDEAGEPLSGALVQVLRQSWVRGRRQLSSGVADSDQTDDLGQFRLHGIPPGTYVLSTSLQDSPIPEFRAVMLGSATTFYPGTTSAADAQAIDVVSGQDISGLSLAIVPARAASISGVVRTSDGQPAASARVTVWQPMPFTSGGMSSFSVPIRPDGSFVLRNLPPGEYTLDAQSQVGRDSVAAANVVLDGSDLVIPLTLRKGDTLRGRVVFDTGAPLLDLRTTAVTITPEAADPAQMFRPSNAIVNHDDWTIEADGLTGRRRLRVTVMEGWALKSIRLDGADITDLPIDFSGKDVEGVEVLLTQRLTTVTGAVTDARGQKVTDATIVMFADDRDKWGPDSRFIQSARPNQDGRFSVRGLPPGRYLALALGYLDQGEETNPETLERLRRLGTGVTLAEGETRTLDMRVSDLR